MTPSPEQIARWLAPPLSAEDQAALESWLEGSADHQRQWADWNLLWKQYGELTLPEPGEGGKARVWSRMEAEMRPSRVQRLPAWWTVAAAVAFLLLAGGWWQATRPKTWEALEGTTKVWLPDSSRVTLRKGARLTARRDFGRQVRQVHLEGEAFFEVRRDTSRAFVVQLGEGSLRVLGTSFLVQAGDPVRAQVHTGKVAVYGMGRDTLHLLPGQQAALLGSQWERQSGALASVAWATGVFRFQAVPLGEALDDIREATGVAIGVERADMNNCLLTATFEREAPASMLAAIAAVFDMETSGNEQTGFTLRGGTCAGP